MIPEPGHVYECCGKVGRISRHESWCRVNQPDPHPADVERAGIAELSDETFVRDLPCPKCRSADVSMRYCDANREHAHDSANLCSHGDSEHFHRHCRRCQHTWRTDDVPNAQVTPCGVCKIRRR